MSGQPKARLLTLGSLDQRTVAANGRPRSYATPCCREKLLRFRGPTQPDGHHDQSAASALQGLQHHLLIRSCISGIVEFPLAT
jgi:hypothetical protein